MYAYRFALRCKPAQQRQLRRVWNHALAEQRARHARGEKHASYADMCKWLGGKSLEQVAELIRA